MTMSKQDIIDEIMDYFNFERVHQAMVVLNWEYAECECVPDIPTIRRKARDLIKEVLDKKTGHVMGTGGFEVLKTDYGAKLQFVVSQWNVEPK